MAPFFFIVVGSLVTICAGYFDWMNKLEDQKKQTQQERKRREDSESLLRQSNDILSKTTDIISSQQTLVDTSSKVIELQNALNKKNLEIQKLQNSTLQKLTGGESVPQLQFIVAGGASVYIRIANSTNLPIRNVVVKLERVIYDYFDKVDSQGNRTTNNPNVTKEWEFDKGDLSIKSDKVVSDERFVNLIDNFSYTFEVRWLNGYYLGGFTIKDGKTNWKLDDGSISQHTKGFDCKEAVMINYKPLRVDNSSDK